MLGTPLFDMFVRVMEILMVVLAGFYTIFAFVMVRQVQLMNTTFKTIWGSIFIFLAALQFFAAVGVTLAAVALVFF